MVKLSYKWHGAKDAENIAIVLHGIMGSKKNWHIFLSKLALKMPNWSFLALDLRNHGESPKGISPYDVFNVAKDVVETCNELDIKPTSILGHSYGGKIAIIAALDIPSIKSAVMLDSPAGIVNVRPLTPTESKNALDVMATLEKLPPDIPSIQFLIDFLSSHGISENIALWMSTNLERCEDTYRLVFDPKEVSLMLKSFLQTDVWPHIKDLCKKAQVHMIAAQHGGRLGKEDELRLKELAGANGFFYVLENSGHFLHSDNPEGLIKLLSEII